MCVPLIQTQAGSDAQCAYHWPTITVLWLTLNAVPMWYTIYANRRLRPNPERDAKYAPFVRYDYD